MSSLTALWPSFLGFTIKDTGISQEARRMRKHRSDVFSDLFESESLSGEPLRENLESLRDVVAEASEPNWDGYGSKPISKLNYHMAEQFLISLFAAQVPLPEMGADPDGQISFDWYQETNNIFSISISAAGKLTYAGIFGINEVRGVEFFENEIPETILLNLKRLRIMESDC